TMTRHPPRSPLFPYTTLFRSAHVDFLRFHERTPEWWQAARLGHAAHPDNKFLEQCAAEADIDEVARSEEFHHNARLTSAVRQQRSEEHTSELQSRENLVCRLL